MSYREPHGVTTPYFTSNNVEIAEWISGGNPVIEAWTTPHDYTCNGTQGETVCVWYNTVYTAYTVRNAYTDTCKGTSYHSDPFILSSPNRDNAGGGEYCVVGPCRHSGDSYWNCGSPDGGGDRKQQLEADLISSP
jgi:hypothetical protein